MRMKRRRASKCRKRAECAGCCLFTSFCFPYIIGKSCLRRSRTPQGRLHTVTNCVVVAAAIAVCFVFWAGSSVKAQIEVGAQLELDSQFITKASCPWEDKSSEGCLICSQMEGPPHPTTAGCGMACEATWMRFSDTSNTTDVWLTVGRRGAVASMEDLELITVSIHETNNQGVGFVNKLQLLDGDTPQFQWTGHDATECGGVLHASNFTLAEGVTLKEPLFFDRILMTVNKPEARVPAIVSAVGVASRSGVVKAPVEQQVLHAGLFVATPILAVLYLFVVNEASFYSRRSANTLAYINRDSREGTIVLICLVSIIFSVFLFIVLVTWPWELEADEVWAQLRYRWHSWGLMVCLFLFSIAVTMGFGVRTILKRRDRWGQSASFVVGHTFVAFGTDTDVMAIGGLAAALAVTLLVWSSTVAVAVSGVSWGWYMDAITAAVWLLWLWQIKGTFQYLATGVDEGRKHALQAPHRNNAGMRRRNLANLANAQAIQPGAKPDTAGVAAVQAKIGSLTTKQATTLEKALLAWRLKRQCRHGGAMLRRLKAAVLHMKVQPRKENGAGSLPIQVVVDGEATRAAKADCDSLFGEVAQPAQVTVLDEQEFAQETHLLGNLLPLLGREHVPDSVLAPVKAELRNRAYGCGVMVPLAHDGDTDEESKAAQVLDQLPPEQPTSWTNATFHVDGVAPAPLLPLRHARVPVAKGSDEWKRVVKQFGSGGGKVARIDRIQNPLLWQRYRERVRELRLELMHTRRYVAQTPELMMEGRTRLRSTSSTTADSSHSQHDITKARLPPGSGVQQNRAHTVRLATTSKESSIAGWTPPATRYSIPSLPVGHRELVMWHGCSAAAVDSICDSGFQPKMTTRAAIGFGTYFAPMSTTAVTYSKQKASSNPSGGKAIIMAVVAAGIDVVGNQSLKLPCYASHPSQRVMWDVTTNQPSGGPPSMMAVFDKRQAYPAYVLHLA